MSLHCFFLIIEKTFGVVNTIMRLPLQSPRYCGQFSQSGLFCCCFQNWNTRYLLTLFPKTIVSFLSLWLLHCGKKRQHHLLPQLHLGNCVCVRRNLLRHTMHNVSVLYIYLWMSLFTLTSSGTLNFLRSAINFCLKFFWC